MNPKISISDKLTSRQFAILLLASAIAIPVFAQQAQPTPATQSADAATSQPSYAPPSAKASQPPQEGFWGRVNPFARKKWVKKQLDPLNDQLTELDEVNSKNARDIRDVDSRAQAGIGKAQLSADVANQTASLAGTKAQHANSTAMNANNHVDSLNNTVNNLDTYNQKAEIDVTFRGGQPVLSADARNELDNLANQLNGQSGYILELEAHHPAAGSTGIMSSRKLADVVERYMVVQHDIPVYRMHAVALGNAQVAANDDSGKPAHAKFVRTSSVHIRLMENSLAAQGGAASLTVPERP